MYRLYLLWWWWVTSIYFVLQYVSFKVHQRTSIKNLHWIEVFLFLLIIFLDMMLLFSHMIYEVNVTSPDHRLANPQDPGATLFSRLHLMENYRLINDKMCLHTQMLDSSDGMWWMNTGWELYDPFITSIPSAGYHDNITHVKVSSCTWVE